jgi:uncharacterized YceG family protein
VSPLFKRGGGDSRERTAEERERARAERAARRAERRGEPVPDLPEPEAAPPEPDPVEADDDRSEAGEVGAEPEAEPHAEPVAEAVSPPAPDPAPPPPAPDPAPPPPAPDPAPPPAPDPAPDPAPPPPAPDPAPPPAPDPVPPPSIEHDPEPVVPPAREPEPALSHDDHGRWPADPADESWPADPADEHGANAPWPADEGDPKPLHPIAPDDPLVGPQPQPHGQATAEIPFDELPDGGASFLEAEGEAHDYEYADDHGHEPPTPPPPRPRPHATEPPRGRGRTWFVRIVAVLALLLVAAAIWFVVSLFQPFKGSPSTHRSTVFIPKGADAGRIGDILERRGVISSSFFFGLRARLAGKRNDLKPGVYALHPDSSYGDVLTTLSKGPPPVREVSITVPEGRSRREEAARIRTNSNLQGSYLAATRQSPRLKPTRYGAPRSTPSLEGFLFPATYELRSTAPVTQLVDQQLTAFKRAIRRVPMGAAHRKNLTTYDVLIIASMVEREAMLRRERPIIAGVIYNRLRRNIPLGIDATIRYATGNWLRPLTESQLRIRSPYNTRSHQGLPPTPIGSPGIASIRAAAHPKRTPYLYYVVKPGGCGEHVFARTFAQFQRASARYNAARARSGGRSPTKCP